MEDLHRNLWPVLLVAATWAWKHLRAVAAEAVAYAEKQGVLADGKLTNEELEAVAVYVVKRRTGLPEFVIRALVRAVCRWRKKVKVKTP